MAAVGTAGRGVAIFLRLIKKILRNFGEEHENLGAAGV